MYGLYNLLLGIAALGVVPWLRSQRSALRHERLGIYPPDLGQRIVGRRVIWVHSASVGELLASVPLVRRIRERFPAFAVVTSTTSLAGREIAGRLPEADAAVLLPLDLRPCVERALDAVRPSLFVFTETEIWPNLLRALARRSVPAVLVSGRISPRAFARYRWIRGFLSEVLSQVRVFGMQSETEAERIRFLGAPPDRVVVTGSLKLDAVPTASRLAIAGTGPLWVVGSTHAGEEEACLAVFGRLRPRFPELRILLAPRHLTRIAEVESLLERSGLAFIRRSRVDGEWNGAPEILLLDTLGELAGFYGRADVAFVGGTLVPIGGHNLLEPARAGVPVLFGPHVESVAEMARRLEEAGGGQRVADPRELEEEVARLLDDPERRRAMGQRAREAFSSGDVAERSLELLGQVLAS